MRSLRARCHSFVVWDIIQSENLSDHTCNSALRCTLSSRERRAGSACHCSVASGLLHHSPAASPPKLPNVLFVFHNTAQTTTETPNLIIPRL